MSKLVEKQLTEYNLEILQSLAIITDLAEGTFEFWLCTLIVDQICMYFVGMACDYVAAIVVSYVCAIICGGPWNWVCWGICIAGMYSFVYLICTEVAHYGCTAGSYHICLQI